MSKIRTIPYLSGFDVKPSTTTSIGVVTFTDGTNEIAPNQLQCEAYGYTYNQADGTCSIFRFNTNLNTSFSNATNKLQGAGNTTETGTNNTYIIGENNTVKGLSRNNIIVGNQNEIANGVNNANVFGTLGEATADNSIVLGGNASADNLGERQTMTFMYGKTTTDNSTVDAFLNNTTDSYFVVPENTAIYFQSESLAVRVGGSSGSGAVGDFKAWVERGVVINKSGTLSIQRSRTSPASSGTTTGWSPINSVSGTNFLQTVKGANNMDIEWASTIRMTQIKTGVAL
jgi:hypothetical protein